MSAWLESPLVYTVGSLRWPRDDPTPAAVRFPLRDLSEVVRVSAELGHPNGLVPPH